MPEHTSRLGVLDLGKDVFAVNFELIQAKADLKNPCLVSHGFRILARPWLYRNFEINIRSREEWDRFLRCLAAGAALNFRHTRSLTIWDSRRSLEPKHILQESMVYMPPMFDGREFLSDSHNLDDESWMLLDNNEETLRHVHVNVADSVVHVATLEAVRTMDIQLRDGPDTPNLEALLDDWFRIRQGILESVYLQVSDTLRDAIADMHREFWSELVEKKRTTAHMKRLKDLSLHKPDWTPSSPLSFHNHDVPQHGWRANWTLNEADLRAITTSCPNLEQFELQVDEGLRFLTTERSYDDSEDYKDFENRRLNTLLEYLRELRNLRILHFRQQTWFLLAPDQPRPLQSDSHVSLNIQAFVNRILLYLHQECNDHRLRYVVWGSEDPGDMSPWGPDFEAQAVAQHCYIKGQATDGVLGGRCIPAALPISKARMNLYDYDLDILNYNPQPDRVVRLPGRFYDD
ncbi:hypothetical protein BU23DRAFT_564659 [Bimuria novae-zelandiae CBS 107.79]|uniref:Uncharacterized protein n=1 Tax=Bimuria novae-zelandiae CBS 107.79 TaxID=1447943 RepID=A0A6A5VJH2_9PLEO|nr:hypothetical protein BU23DRAFT_564659 [Bimuria novae-zelandiae CBS 107.79]